MAETAINESKVYLDEVNRRLKEERQDIIESTAIGMMSTLLLIAQDDHEYANSVIAIRTELRKLAKENGWNFENL